jgi:hypothetical protein
LLLLVVGGIGAGGGGCDAALFLTTAAAAPEEERIVFADIIMSLYRLIQSLSHQPQFLLDQKVVLSKSIRATQTLANAYMEEQPLSYYTYSNKQSILCLAGLALRSFWCTLPSQSAASDEFDSVPASPPATHLLTPLCPTLEVQMDLVTKGLVCLGGGDGDAG